MLLANIFNLLLTFNQYVTSSILSLFYKQNLKITFGLNADSYLFFLSWPSLSYFGHSTEKEMKAGNFQLVLTPLTLLIGSGWLFLGKERQCGSGNQQNTVVLPVIHLFISHI